MIVEPCSGKHVRKAYDCVSAAEKRRFGGTLVLLPGGFGGVAGQAVVAKEWYYGCGGISARLFVDLWHTRKGLDQRVPPMATRHASPAAHRRDLGNCPGRKLKAICARTL